MSETPSYIPVDTSRTNYWLTAVGAFGSIILFAIILLIAYVPNLPPSVKSHVADTRAENLRKLQAEDRSKLNSYQIDPITGDILIPIERSMDVTVAQIQKEND